MLLLILRFFYFVHWDDLVGAAPLWHAPRSLLSLKLPSSDLRSPLSAGPPHAICVSVQYEKRTPHDVGASQRCNAAINQVVRSSRLRGSGDQEWVDLLVIRCLPSAARCERRGASTRQFPSIHSVPRPNCRAAVKSKLHVLGPAVIGPWPLLFSWHIDAPLGQGLRSRPG